MAQRQLPLTFTIILLFSMIFQGWAQAPVYNVKTYGAKGDGKNLDNKAIDRAIDAANAAGGGTVYFPAGDYLSVTIHLKSNVGLYLDHGCTIIAATTSKDVQYDHPEKSENNIYQDFGHSHFRNGLIVGENLQNISITGPGRIWGRGLIREDGVNGVNNGYANKAISLKLCRNVILRDFTVEKGGWFGFLLTAIDNATIDNIKMDTNRDGIDLTSSKNVRISNCTINSPGDDAIVLKSDYALNYPRVTENITITNCQVSGYEEGSLLDGTYKTKGRKNPSGRIKLGTESNGGFKNIAITNCVFVHCRGLAIETVDGAELEDIVISNITMRDITNAPLFIRLGARQRGPEGSPYSKLRRVMISNIIAYDVTGEQGAIISGIPGHDIEDLTLSNIHFYFKGGGTQEQAAIEIPPLIDSYPDPNRFGITPAYGFFIRNVKNLIMNNIKLSYSKPDLRPAFLLDNVTDADFQQIRAQQTNGAPMFMLNTVKNFNLSNSNPIPNIKLDNVDKKQL